MQSKSKKNQDCQQKFACTAFRYHAKLDIEKIHQEGSMKKSNGRYVLGTRPRNSRLRPGAR